MGGWVKSSLSFVLKTQNILYLYMLPKPVILDLHCNVVFTPAAASAAAGQPPTQEQSRAHGQLLLVLVMVREEGQFLDLVEESVELVVLLHEGVERPLVGVGDVLVVPLQVIAVLRRKKKRACELCI